MEGVWFAIVTMMLAVYAVLDGFDFGAGALHRLVARTDLERRTVLAAIGPFWDGNEVWLVAAGGVLFMAFPRLYSAAFSGFYMPLMIVLWLLDIPGGLDRISLPRGRPPGTRVLGHRLRGQLRRSSPWSSGPPSGTWSGGCRSRRPASSPCPCSPTSCRGNARGSSTGTRPWRGSSRCWYSPATGHFSSSGRRRGRCKSGPTPWPERPGLRSWYAGLC